MGYDYANGDGIDCAKYISTNSGNCNTADDGITPSHTHNLYNAIGNSKKQLEWIQDANHYYFGQPEKSKESAKVCFNWLAENDLI